MGGKRGSQIFARKIDKRENCSSTTGGTALLQKERGDPSGFQGRGELRKEGLFPRAPSEEDRGWELLVSPKGERGRISKLRRIPIYPSKEKGAKRRARIRHCQKEVWNYSPQKRKTICLHRRPEKGKGHFLKGKGAQENLAVQNKGAAILRGKNLH